MHIPPIYAAAAAIVLTVAATALAVALSVGHTLSFGVAAVVFSTGLVTAGVLTRTGRMGVASAAVCAVLAAAVAVALSPRVWLGLVTGAAVGWYTYMALLYRPAPCEPSASSRPGAGSGEPLS